MTDEPVTGAMPTAEETGAFEAARMRHMAELNSQKRRGAKVLWRACVLWLIRPALDQWYAERCRIEVQVGPLHREDEVREAVRAAGRVDMSIAFPPPLTPTDPKKET